MDEELLNEDEEDFLNAKDQDTIVQRTCQNIDSINGEIKELKHRQSVVSLSTSPKMILDKTGLIHSGNLYSSAAYSALLAINHPHAIIIGSEVKYLAPIELGNEIIFRAHTLQEDTKKREVKVEGFALDIKIFDAMFYVAVFERHVLNLHIVKEMEKRMGK